MQLDEQGNQSREEWGRAMSDTQQTAPTPYAETNSIVGAEWAELRRKQESELYEMRTQQDDEMRDLKEQFDAAIKSVKDKYQADKKTLLVRRAKERADLQLQHSEQKQQLEPKIQGHWTKYSDGRALQRFKEQQALEPQKKEQKRKREIERTIQELRQKHGFTANNQYDLAEQIIAKLDEMQKMYQHLQPSASGLSSDQRAVLHTEKIFRRAFAIIMGPESLGQLPVVSKAPESARDIDALLEQADAQFEQQNG